LKCRVLLQVAVAAKEGLVKRIVGRMFSSLFLTLAKIIIMMMVVIMMLLLLLLMMMMMMMIPRKRKMRLASLL